MVSFTRRTPPATEAAMREVFAALPGVVWDGRGENPYFAFLAHADAILVTEDSTNLATDAAATGAALFTLGMAGRSAKLARFHADLQSRGLARPFDGAFTAQRHIPLAETDRAAAELLRRYDGSG